MAKRKKKSEEEISLDNELLKLKLMAEYGGDFFGSEKMPPEIENAFLKQVSKFHKIQNDTPFVTVKELIGNPEFNLVTDLSVKELKKELSKFCKLLERKRVMVVRLSEVPDSEFYRFITEEVFKIEVQDFRGMPNWRLHFVYEEYHPNDEFEIKTQCKTGVSMLFEKSFGFYDFVLGEELKNKLGLNAEREEIIELIEKFKNQFNQVKIKEIENKILLKEERSAKVETVANIELQTEKGKRFKKEVATIYFDLEKGEEQIWFIVKIDFDPLYLI